LSLFSFQRLVFAAHCYTPLRLAMHKRGLCRHAVPVYTASQNRPYPPRRLRRFNSASSAQPRRLRHLDYTLLIINPAFAPAPRSFLQGSALADKQTNRWTAPMH